MAVERAAVANFKAGLHKESRDLWEQASKKWMEYVDAPIRSEDDNSFLTHTIE